VYECYTNDLQRRKKAVPLDLQYQLQHKSLNANDEHTFVPKDMRRSGNNQHPKPPATRPEPSQSNTSSLRPRVALFVSPSSEGFSPSPRKVASPRGTKRKRTAAAAAAAAAKDEEDEDEDEEMADASSRSRSITPAPAFKIHSKRRTTLADSDDEVSEKAKSRSLSRSATPAPPPVKRRKVEGKRKVVLEDSDDEME
jgi:hypothetical protein